MGKQRLEAELGLNINNFLDGLRRGESGLGQFGKNIAMMTTAVTVAAGAFKILTDWFKSTDEGARVMNISLRTTKQLLNDIMLGQKARLGQAAKLAAMESEQIYQDPAEAYHAKKLQSELDILIRDSFDNTKSHAEKLEDLTKAMAKEKELKAYLLKDAKEELKIAYEQWKLNVLNTEARKKFYELAGRVKEIESMDSRRLQSRYTGEIVAEQERQAEAATEAAEKYADQVERARLEAEKLAEAFQELKDENYEWASSLDARSRYLSILPTKTSSLKFGGMARGGANLAAGPSYAEPVKDMTQALIAQQEAVSILQDSFTALFTSTGDGFANMINTMIEGIKRMVAELLAKAAVLTLLRVLFPGTSIGANATTGLMNMFGSGMFSGGSTIGNVSSLVSSPQTINIVGHISGKDIVLTSQRYLSGLGH